MAFTTVFAYDSKTPGKRAGPFRSLSQAARAVKCSRRHPKSVFRAERGRWEVNCGDTVVADVPAPQN